jgi:aromatic amino acid transport protein AroP
VKVFGEMEFWFAIIKVVAVVAMIMFGGWLLFSGNGGPQAVRNLWEGRLPAARLYRAGNDDGDHHVLLRRSGAGGDHRCGSGQQESIPKATNQVIYRILIFYVGSLAVLLSAAVDA